MFSASTREDQSAPPASGVLAPGFGATAKARHASGTFEAPTPCPNAEAAPAPSGARSAPVEAITLLADSYECALQWWRRGYNVVPQKAGGAKHPAVKWKELQTRRVTESELRLWRPMFANGVGFITGAISCVIVVETDGPEGEALIAEFERLHAALPQTLIIRSGSGRGVHRHFRHPGYRVKTKANPEIKVDVKGDGGFAVLPPSQHKSGGRYDIVQDAAIADLPAGLLEFIEQQAALATTGPIAKYGESGRATMNGNRASVALSALGELPKHLSGGLFKQRAINIGEIGEPPLPPVDLDMAQRADGSKARILIEQVSNANLRTVLGFILDVNVFARQAVTREQWLALPRMLMKLGTPEATVWEIWAAIYHGDNHDADTREAAQWVSSSNGFGRSEFFSIVSSAAKKANRTDILDAVEELWRGATAAGNDEQFGGEGGPSHFVSFGAFVMSAKIGLVIEIEKKGRGEETTIETQWISAPFEIVGLSRDPEGRGWGKWLRWRDPDRRVHTRHLANAAMHGDPATLCQMLVEEGLTISRNMHKHLAAYLSGASIRSRVTLVGRTGWHELGGQLVFVLPEQTIASRESEKTFLDAAAIGPYETRGSLKDWQAGVGTLAAGHALPVFAISAALAGPLLRLVGQEGGGVHEFGPSSIGKSSTLQAAASVWGRGATPGYVRSWRATANGLEGAAASASDTCLVLDELGVGEARDVAAAIYGLANGAGKARAARDGSLRQPKSWRVFFLSSGEIPLETKLAEDRGRMARAGQLVRLLDIPADRGLGFGAFDHAGPDGDAGKLSDSFKRAAVAAYGTAGREFIRRIVERGVEQVGAEARRAVETFVAREIKPGSSEQVRRAAQRFGLIATAGELAIFLGVAPWPPGEATKAASWAFKRWIETRGGTGATEARQAIERVRAFIEAYGDARFEALDGPDARPVLDRAGWREGSGDKQVWLIPSESWKQMCGGLDPKLVARTLADKGILQRTDGYQAVRKIRGTNKRVYVVTTQIYDGE